MLSFFSASASRNALSMSNCRPYQSTMAINMSAMRMLGCVMVGDEDSS